MLIHGGYKHGRRVINTNACTTGRMLACLPHLLVCGLGVLHTQDAGVETSPAAMKFRTTYQS